MKKTKNKDPWFYVFKHKIRCDLCGKEYKKIHIYPWHMGNVKDYALYYGDLWGHAQGSLIPRSLWRSNIVKDPKLYKFFLTNRKRISIDSPSIQKSMDRLEYVFGCSCGGFRSIALRGDKFLKIQRNRKNPLW